MKQIGPYVIGERLSSGGRMEQHRALDSRSGQQVAVLLFLGRMEKRWPPWEDPRIARLLDHPTLVRLLDVVEAPDHVAFITEHVDGVDLRRLLSRGRVPLPAALTVAVELCRALHVAHDTTGLDGSRFPFIHGWLCPRCILLSREGAVKLGGFGIGRPPEDGDDWLDGDASEERLSYLSPEQVRAEPEDPRTDVFLLGIVLHEMIAGERPFVGETPLALLNAIRSGQRRSLLTSLPFSGEQTASATRRLLEGLDDLLGWTLSPRREERPKSAAELLQAIEVLARRFEVSIGPGVVRPYVSALTA